MRILVVIAFMCVCSISDGQEWKSFSEFEILSIQMGLSPSQMKVDPSTNNVWFTTGTRLHSLGEGVSNHITYVDHSITGFIDYIEVKDGKVWMVTENINPTGSLYSYNGTIVNHEVDLNVNAYTIQFDNEDSLWIGSDNSDGIGVHAFKNGSYIAYDDMNSPVVDLNIKQVFEDSYDRKWVVYESSPSIRIWDMNSGTSDLYSYFLGHNLTQFIQVNKVAQSPSGAIWIASSDGIFRYDEVDEDWVSYNTGNSDMPINEVMDIQFDKSGKMWALFKDTALAYSFNMTDWTHFDSSNSPLRFLGGFQGIRSFTIDTLDNVWTADDDYVYVFNSDSLTGWLNLDEKSEKNSIVIFPNPCTDYFEFDFYDENAYAQLTNLAGNVIVSSLPLSKGINRIEMSEYESGPYVLIIHSPKSTTYHRIIKH